MRNFLAPILNSLLIYGQLCCMTIFWKTFLYTEYLTQFSVYSICAERIILLDNGQINFCSYKTLIFKHIESEKITKFKIGANKSLPLVYLEVVKRQVKKIPRSKFNNSRTREAKVTVSSFVILNIIHNVCVACIRLY